MSFAELLREVEKVEGLERIRFMTPHPKDLSDDLIEVMATSKKVCKHMHLPMQSGSSRLLKLMNRHYTKEQYVALAKKIQERIPGVSFTTDIIVGFPGETEEDFKETLDVVREVGFDSAYTYVYSSLIKRDICKELQEESRRYRESSDRRREYARRRNVNRKIGK